MTALALVWIGIAAYGVYVAVAGLREANRDLAAASRSRGNGARILVAQSAIRLRALLLAALVLFVAVGLNVFLTPPDSVARLVVGRGAILLAAAAVVAALHLDLADGRRLRRML